jgi:hypothetical protein
VVALEVVQGAHLQQHERLGEVDVLADDLVLEDPLRLEDVLGDEVGVLVLLEQRPAVRQHHRVVVDVDDLGLRVDPLDDLVGVLRRRQAGAEVEELGDPGLAGQEPAGANKETTVFEREVLGFRRGLLHLVQDLPVDLVVVLPQQEGVVHPRDARSGRVDSHRHSFGPGRGVRHLEPRKFCVESLVLYVE